MKKQKFTIPEIDPQSGEKNPYYKKSTMKAQIIERIYTLQVEAATKNTQHNNLNQIDMLSGEGNQLRKQIASLIGKMEALNWVLTIM